MTFARRRASVGPRGTERRLRKALIAVALIASIALSATLAVAAVVGPTPVKTAAANEQNPAAATDWFAWTQSPAAHPNRTSVWAEPTPIDGTGAFKVNTSGRGWTGGIEGDTLIYQRIASGNSDIKLYDLATQTAQSDPPVNTRHWEWHPSISMDSTGDRWIVFGRQNVSTGTQRVIAYNLDTSATRVLQLTTRRGASLIPGQVNGDWATWTACMPNCNVWYDNLLDGSAAAKVPRPAGVTHQYASSVVDDGTVYFAKSGNGCGANVKIIRYQASLRTQMADLPPRRDVFFTYAATEADGNHVFFDRVNCRVGSWNIYKLVDGP